MAGYFADKNGNGGEAQITQRFAIQVETGVTPKGKPRHRTISIRDLRADISQEELTQLMTILEPMLAHPVKGAKLVTQEVRTIWQAEAPSEAKTDKQEGASKTSVFRGGTHVPRSITMGELKEIAAELLAAEPKTPIDEDEVEASTETTAIEESETAERPKTVITSEVPKNITSRFPGVRLMGFQSKKK